MPDINQIFILAAGRGERMRPVTDIIPKPLVKVNNKSLIDYIIEKVTILPKVNKIVVNAYYLAEIIEKHLKTLNNPKILLSKETEKLETGGGLLNALPLFDINKPILVINSDLIWNDKATESTALQLVINSFDEKRSDILLGVVPTGQFIGYEGVGDFYFDKSNNNLIKNHNLTHTFVGIQIIHPRIFKNYPNPPFSLNYFYKNAVQSNGVLKRIKAVELKGQFFHVGTVDMLKRLNG